MLIAGNDVAVAVTGRTAALPLVSGFLEVQTRVNTRVFLSPSADDF